MKLCIWPRYELRGAGARVPLARHEGRIMTALLAHREATLELLIELLWPDPDAMPDLWYRSLMVQMHKLRRKLAPLGWDVVARQGFGWRLEERKDGRREAA